MAVIVEATVVSDSAAPVSTPLRILRAVPDAKIELESFVPLGNAAIPYFWVWYPELPEFEEALSADPAVTNVECLEHMEEGGLYTVEWTVDDPAIDCLRQTNGALVEARGTVDEWKLKLWFEHNEDASIFNECCITQDVPMRVDRVYSVSAGKRTGALTVTPEQRDALLLAYEDGYFKQPRETTQQELGGKLGISPTAVGTRLRRGLGNLVEDMLIE